MMVLMVGLIGCNLDDGTVQDQRINLTGADDVDLIAQDRCCLLVATPHLVDQAAIVRQHHFQPGSLTAIQSQSGYQDFARQPPKPKGRYVNHRSDQYVHPRKKLSESCAPFRLNVIHATKAEPNPIRQYVTVAPMTFTKPRFTRVIA